MIFLWQFQMDIMRVEYLSIFKNLYFIFGAYPYINQKASWKEKFVL